LSSEEQLGTQGLAYHRRPNRRGAHPARSGIIQVQATLAREPPPGARSRRPPSSAHLDVEPAWRRAEPWCGGRTRVKLLERQFECSRLSAPRHFECSRPTAAAAAHWQFACSRLDVAEANVGAHDLPGFVDQLSWTLKPANRQTLQAEESSGRANATGRHCCSGIASRLSTREARATSGSPHSSSCNHTHSQSGSVQGQLYLDSDDFHHRSSSPGRQHRTATAVGVLEAVRNGRGTWATGGPARPPAPARH
jgi:hypothetical protein